MPGWLEAYTARICLVFQPTVGEDYGHARTRRAGSLRKKTTITVTVTVTTTVGATPAPVVAEAEEMPHGKKDNDEEELEDSWKVFFILVVLCTYDRTAGGLLIVRLTRASCVPPVVCCMVVYVMIKAHFHHLPESAAVVFVGMCLNAVHLAFFGVNSG